MTTAAGSPWVEGEGQLSPSAFLKRMEKARKGVLKRAGHGFRMQDASGDWAKIPGVTSVIGLKDKSRMLMKWAAREQMAADIASAWRLYRDGVIPPGLNEEQFTATFRALSDEQAAYLKKQAEACDFGKAVHHLVEHWISEQVGGKVTAPEDPSWAALELFEMWLEWRGQYEFTPLAQEFPVWSAQHRYAGITDALGWVTYGGRRRLALVDWKTSKDTYEDHHVQNVAYRYAFKEITGQDTLGLLVRIPKTGEDQCVTDAVDPAEDGERFSVFLALRSIWEWSKRKDEEGLEQWKAKKRAEEAAAVRASLTE